MQDKSQSSFQVTSQGHTDLSKVAQKASQRIQVKESKVNTLKEQVTDFKFKNASQRFRTRESKSKNVKFKASQRVTGQGMF